MNKMHEERAKQRMNKTLKKLILHLSATKIKIYFVTGCSVVKKRVDKLNQFFRRLLVAMVTK